MWRRKKWDNSCMATPWMSGRPATTLGHNPSFGSVCYAFWSSRGSCQDVLVHCYSSNATSNVIDSTYCTMQVPTLVSCGFDNSVRLWNLNFSNALCIIRFSACPVGVEFANHKCDVSFKCLCCASLVTQGRIVVSCLDGTTQVLGLAPPPSYFNNNLSEQFSVSITSNTSCGFERRNFPWCIVKL